MWRCGSATDDAISRWEAELLESTFAVFSLCCSSWGHAYGVQGESLYPGLTLRCSLQGASKEKMNYEKSLLLAYKTNELHPSRGKESQFYSLPLRQAVASMY